MKKSSPELEKSLIKAAGQELIIQRYENNRYLKVSYKGSGGLISDKWNVKIYTSGSVVCNDEHVLQAIMDGTLQNPDDSKIVLQCDDSGWGSCVGGVMVGVTDGKRIETDVVDIYFFRPPAYETKEYLHEYAGKGFRIIRDRFKASPKTHRIEICTGYVNTALKDMLRNQHFDVRVTEIKGLLQDNLERMYREYIRELTGLDLGYDPKEIKQKYGTKAVGKRYYETLSWAKANAPHLIKTGWKSIV